MKLQERLVELHAELGLAVAFALDGVASKLHVVASELELVVASELVVLAAALGKLWTSSAVSDDGQRGQMDSQRVSA